MATAEPTSVETSAYLGAIFVLVGLATWLSHATMAAFSGWGWAIVFGSAWVVFGALLLFPDIRVYQDVPTASEMLYQS